jgi:hypothetical protein
MATVGVSGAARAASALVDTAGFETYADGALTPVTVPGNPQIGQQGWVGIDGASGTTNTQAAVVQSAVVKSGSKALRVDRAPNVDNRWAVLFGTSPDPGELALTLPEHRMSLPTSRFVLIDWDMQVLDAGGNGTTVYGPYFAVEAWDASVYRGLVGSLGVDASTGAVFYRVDQNDSYQETGALVTFGQWNHFAMVLDYALDKYSVFLNGALLKTTTFVDTSLISPFVPGGLNRFTDADITAISMAPPANTASAALAGTAFLDNFRVLNGIPGDFDDDGDIDRDDLLAWRGAYAQTAAGNADGDGDSDGNDFLIWQQNLGVDLSPNAAPASAAVPEPSAGALGILAFAALAAGGRRQRMSPEIGV